MMEKKNERNINNTKKTEALENVISTGLAVLNVERQIVSCFVVRPDITKADWNCRLQDVLLGVPQGWVLWPTLF